MVERIEGSDIICKVVKGGILRDRKGINVPGLVTNLPSLTEKDIKDIKDGIAVGFDYIAASFVRKAQDVLDIKRLLEENNGNYIKVISKIENREGIDNFDEILAVSDGIMVARGDLSVEIPMEEVPIIQKQIIKKCDKAGIPVITATQMMESMMTNPKPTRAEVSDVANSVFDMTSSIMLSGESAMGEYPVECVKTMDRIAYTIERSINYWGRFRKREVSFAESNYEYNINYSTCFAAMNMGASAIFTYTEKGDTPRIVSSFSPNCPVYAITTEEMNYRQLALVWGVFPMLLEHKASIEDLLIEGIKQTKNKEELKDGDIVVIAGGSCIVSDSNCFSVNKVMGGVLKV